MFVTVTICMNYFKEIKVPERAGTPSLCFSGFVSRALARSVLFLASACGAELDGQLRGVHAGLRLLWLLEPLALCVLTGTWGSSLLCVRCRPLPPGVLTTVEVHGTPAGRRLQRPGAAGAEA